MYRPDQTYIQIQILIIDKLKHSSTHRSIILFSATLLFQQKIKKHYYLINNFGILTLLYIFLQLFSTQPCYLRYPDFPYQAHNPALHKLRMVCNKTLRPVPVPVELPTEAFLPIPLSETVTC